MNEPIKDMADTLNRDCDCSPTNVQALSQILSAASPKGASLSILESHPHLFSPAPVFVKPEHAREMQGVVSAVHNVVQLPGYLRQVLASAPAIAQSPRPTEGAFLGFDFHISPQGPRLIEINTNAGGALLNIAAREAQRACCERVADFYEQRSTAPELEQQIVDMFKREWKLARGDRPLRAIAIVDENPVAQYLYPEFELIKALFESHGVEAFITDANELEISGDAVTWRGRPVDLIYNRLTDFYFEDERHAVLREAYSRDLAVVTPHPRAHALYSDKRNLALLSDAAALETIGATAADIDVLTRGVPRTLEVEGCEDRWWRERKQWFFKPTQGFGSRGTYRGDKITRRAFAEVMAGRYVAQEITPPGERIRTVNGDKQAFKVDIRCYAYAGQTQLMAARLYQGQTTNFRTAGGGFAPVFVVGGAGGVQR